MTTGRRIYLACIKKNLSVKTVAELVGLPEEKVEAIITKNEKIPDDKLSWFASLLDSTPSEICGHTTKIEWNDVKKEPPQIEDSYLCYSEELGVIISEFAKCLEAVDKYDFQGEKRSGFYHYEGDVGYIEDEGITHWAYLPAAPTKNKN